VTFRWKVFIYIYHCETLQTVLRYIYFVKFVPFYQPLRMIIWNGKNIPTQVWFLICSHYRRISYKYITNLYIIYRTLLWRLSRNLRGWEGGLSPAQASVTIYPTESENQVKIMIMIVNKRMVDVSVHLYIYKHVHNAL